VYDKLNKFAMSPNLDKSNIEVKTPVQMLKIILQKDLAAF
jgi:hypothetical protein